MAGKGDRRGIRSDLRRHRDSRSDYLSDRSCLSYGAALHFFLVLFSAVSFLVYGIGCFISRWTAREFERYGMPGLRLLVGSLQLCAVVGLLAGLRYPPFGRAAAIGLTLMMLGAVGVRLKIKDTFLQTTPALFYLFLNAYLSLGAG